jgi:hypothetical protein
VLLNRGEAHVVAPCQRRHRGVLAHRALHDVAAGAIRQRLEDPIDLVVREHIYNHLVVR